MKLLATLDAGRARQGEFALDFRCAFVYTQGKSADASYAFWPSYLIEACQRRGKMEDPGVEVSYPVRAGKKYMVDCTFDSDPRFRFKSRFDGEAWSGGAEVETNNPSVINWAKRDGVGHVRFELDPKDNNVLRHSLRSCRVSEVRTVSE